MTLEQAGDMLHETVAHRVSHIVVDRLESIHVDEEQRKRDVVPDVPLHLAVDDLVKKAAIMTPGQRVGHRHKTRVVTSGRP